jgi:hypothetical protein
MPADSGEARVRADMQFSGKQAFGSLIAEKASTFQSRRPLTLAGALV